MAPHYENEASITELVNQFRNKQLPEASWTHEAHLTVAIWFLKNYSYHEAICFLRSGIIEYNASLGGKNTPTSGYHETITLFWIWLIYNYIKAHSELSLLDLTNSFLVSKYADQKLLSAFFTKENLFHTKARSIWIEPELKSLKFPF